MTELLSFHQKGRIHNFALGKSLRYDADNPEYHGEIVGSYGQYIANVFLLTLTAKQT